MSATQSELPDSVWMPKRQLLGDHTAERYTENVRGLYFEGFEQGGGIVSHIGDREWVLWLIGSAYASVVECDDLKMRGEAADLFAEAFAGAAQSANEKQRDSGAYKFVVDVDAVRLNVWHVGTNTA